MKSMKHIAISVVLAIGIFCTVWYSSCSKDACKGVTCVNFGICGGGSCICDSGTGGNNCEVIYRNNYSNTYTGAATFSYNDTSLTNKNHTDNNNTLTFSSGNDTTFDKMQVVWHDGSISLALPIELSNNTASGSDFKVTDTVSSGGYSYIGSGSVSSNLASLTLIQVPTGGGNAATIILNNLTLQ